MKIGIDISQIVYGTGVSVYTEYLVRELLKQDKKNEYVLFGGSGRRLWEIRKFTKSLKGKYKSRLFPFPPTAADVLWNSMHALPVEMFTGKLDVYHSSDWAQAPSRAFKVTTVHDLVPLKFPNESHPKIMGAHKARLGWVKKETDVVIAVSKSTKKDLVEFGIPAKKIKVIYEAANKKLKPASKAFINRTKNKYSVFGDYILAVGLGERKNSERAIKAFERVRKNTDLRMVFAGSKGGGESHIPGVRYIGRVDTFEEMAALYSGAELLLYPSLYEGFGLPILEAMACGCPVVTSNVSSMPEVAGSAAVLVNPKDVDSIVLGIANAMKNKKSLSAKGIRRAKKFSWEKAAKETLEVYAQAK